MRYPNRDSIAWQFDTANLRVICHVEPSTVAPADTFEFPEDIEAIENGSVAYFDAFVSVWFGEDGDDLTYLAHDCLCACAYHTTDEFVESHRGPNPMNRNSSLMRASHGDNAVICHYFPDMVRIACREARDELRKLQSIKLRKVKS